MAVSGSTNWTLDASEIIEEAYERIGQELRTGYDAQTGRRSLNLLLADWANRGIHLWMVDSDSQALTASTANYTLDAAIVDIMDVVVRRSGTDYLLERISRNEYQNLPVKTVEGRPTQSWIDRQRDAPVIYLYPTPENSTDVLRFYKMVRADDIDAAVNNADVLYRFLPALTSGLAYHLAVKRNPQMVPMLKQLYEEEMFRAEQGDRDDTNMRLVPNLRGY